MKDTVTLDTILAKFSIARDYPADMYEEAKKEAKAAIIKLFEQAINVSDPPGVDEVCGRLLRSKQKQAFSDGGGE